MNKVQRSLLLTYIPLTIAILLLDHFYFQQKFVCYIKYLTIISLFVTSLLIKKKYQEQKLLTWSIFFVVIGDFFLVFCDTFASLAGKVLPLGILGFSIAYIFVILTFHKNFKVGKGEVLVSIPILLLSIPVIIRLLPLVKGPLKYGLIIFSLILVYAAWTAMSSLYRGYFPPKNARIIALSGYLMLICDLGVGISVFDPYFQGSLLIWLKHIVWGSYIPAWTLIVYTIAEDRLIKSEFEETVTSYIQQNV